MWALRQHLMGEEAAPPPKRQGSAAIGRSALRGQELREYIVKIVLAPANIYVIFTL